jgi:flagellar biosynthesis anti-sigma factor FlgM
MKISGVESNKAALSHGAAEARILPKDRPRGLVSAKPRDASALSPLEQGMAAAEAALANVPDTRDEIVEGLKERIRKGEYKVSGEEIADMMLRRRAADKIR